MPNNLPSMLSDLAPEPRAGRIRKATRIFVGTDSGRDASGQDADTSPRTYREQLRADLEFHRLLRLGVIAAEFVLVVVAVRLANVETRAFELLATISLGGFLVHHFLPAMWRSNFFGALSVASVPLVLGWEHGAWLLAIAGFLITLCHLPVRLSMRISLVLLAGLALIAERKHVLPWVSPIPTTIWPILGSMFMFRLIVYIYDLKHGAGPFSVGRALSYFFMLPNVCFPLFPVVDYKTLQRSAYNDDSLRVYQTGVKWMLRGLIHLMLYKLVYYMGVVEPGSIVNGMDAARYMVATFLLYLKISGLFHLIVGLLHMYGFGLAETHHLYLFSSSFTDFWRRINIYWKDFIQKLVFNPAYFGLRKLGETRAIIVATLIAFAATWFLHSYQWFWIRGDFPIVWADLVFWLGLGVVVSINVLVESRGRRQRSLTKQARTLREDALSALKISGTFAAICVLWTIWSTPKLEELQLVWQGVLNSGLLDVTVLLGIPIGVGVLGAVLGHRKREVFGVGTGTSAATKTFWPQAAIVSVIAGVLIVVSLRPALLKPLWPELAKVVFDIRHREQLNAADSKKFARGYYEDLGDMTRVSDELWTMYGMRPQGWLESLEFQTRKRNDGIGNEFIPSTAQVSMGAMRTINSLGLRDREYPLRPDPNTLRIALIGTSHDMGAGVNDDETYENIVEDRLNRELGPRTGKKFEILNFSLHAYRPTQKLSVIEQRIFPLQPDVVLYVANTLELDWTFKSVRHLVQNQLLDQFPFIKSAMDRADIKAEALPEDSEILLSKLAPFAEDTLRAVLERFRDGALSRGIRPVLVILEVPTDSWWRDEMFDRLVSLGQAAKLAILDLQGSYASVWNRQSLTVAPWDHHPNAEGHRLLAERLYSLLLKEELVPTETPSARRDAHGRR
jgi:hypothetical protein